jgi:uncharacterized protein YodC (DUF2158 family)
MKEFKIGDTVMLNSGGPAMTVEQTPDPKCVCTVWITESGERRNGSFNSSMLSKAVRLSAFEGVHGFVHSWDFERQQQLNRGA